MTQQQAKQKVINTSRKALLTNATKNLGEVGIRTLYGAVKLPSTYAQTAKDYEQGETLHKAYIKNVGNNWRELISEAAGGIIAGTPTPLKTGNIKGSANISTINKMYDKIGNSMGTHGFISGGIIEFGEEVFKHSLDKLVGADDRTVKQWLKDEGTETAIVLALSQLIMGGAGAGLNIPNKIKFNKQYTEISEKINNHHKQQIDNILTDKKTNIAQKTQALNNIIAQNITPTTTQNTSEYIADINEYIHMSTQNIAQDMFKNQNHIFGTQQTTPQQLPQQQLPQQQLPQQQETQQTPENQSENQSENQQQHTLEYTDGSKIQINMLPNGNIHIEPTTNIENATEQTLTPQQTVEYINAIQNELENKGVTQIPENKQQETTQPTEQQQQEAQAENKQQTQIEQQETTQTTEQQQTQLQQQETFNSLQPQQQYEQLHSENPELATMFMQDNIADIQKQIKELNKIPPQTPSQRVEKLKSIQELNKKLKTYQNIINQTQQQQENIQQQQTETTIEAQQQQENIQENIQEQQQQNKEILPIENNQENQQTEQTTQPKEEKPKEEKPKEIQENNQEKQNNIPDLIKQTTKTNQ